MTPSTQLETTGKQGRLHLDLIIVRKKRTGQLTTITINHQKKRPAKRQRKIPKREF